MAYATAGWQLWPPLLLLLLLTQISWSQGVAWPMQQLKDSSAATAAAAAIMVLTQISWSQGVAWAKQQLEDSCGHRCCCYPLLASLLAAAVSSCDDLAPPSTLFMDARAFQCLPAQEWSSHLHSHTGITSILTMSQSVKLVWIQI